MRRRYSHIVAAVTCVSAAITGCAAPPATTTVGNSAAAPATVAPTAAAAAQNMNGVNGIAAGVQAAKWSSN
jgi:hypothetical protein